MYPTRTDTEQATLEHLPHSPYSYDDKPYLSINRYSVVGFELHEIDSKRALDAHGALDNAYWYNRTREDNRAMNMGQR